MAKADDTPRFRMLRKSEMLEQKAHAGQTTLAERISNGVWPPPVALGPRTNVWLEHECDAVLAARVRGESDEQIKALVTGLVAQRKEAA